MLYFQPYTSKARRWSTGNPLHKVSSWESANETKEYHAVPVQDPEEGDQSVLPAEATHCGPRKIYHLPTMTLPGIRRRTWAIIALVGTSIWFFVIVFHGKSTSAKIRNWLPNLSNILQEPVPSSIYSTAYLPPKLHDLSRNTVLATKTGYSVMFERLPVHIIESRPDIPLSHFYADADVRVGDIHIQNILKNLSREVREQPKFAGYTQMHQAIRDRVPPELGWDQWDVDKYKFLPMHGDMYRRHPDASWYVAVDGDTFLFWSTLLSFLSRFNPKDQLYFGLPDHHGNGGAGNTVWAVGGAGYVLSQGVMQQTYERDPWGFEHKWSEVLMNSPGGDVALARAIYQSSNILNNSLSGGGLMFSTNPPRDIEFTRNNWLSPLFSLHHLKAFQIHDLGEFEQTRLAYFDFEDGIRYCDVFNHFAPAFLSTSLALYESQTLPDVHVQRRGWSAFGEHQIYYNEDFANLEGMPYDVHFCEHLCDKDVKCLSWVWEDHWTPTQPRCTLSLGNMKMGGPGSGVVSGWRLDRISEMRKDLDCDNLETRKLADLKMFGPPSATLYPVHQLSVEEQQKAQWAGHQPNISDNDGSDQEMRCHWVVRPSDAAVQLQQ